MQDRNAKPETTPEEAAEALWDRMVGENGARTPERWKELVAQAFRERDHLVKETA